MARAKLIIVVAVAIVLAQLQCVAACAAVSGSAPQSAPPCHKHHNQSSGSCAHQIIVTPSLPPDSPQLETPMLPFIAAAPAVSWGIPSLVRISARDSSEFSPPECGKDSSAVLRI